MRANLLYEFKRAIDGAECIGGNKKGYNNEHHKRKKNPSTVAKTKALLNALSIACFSS